MRKGKEQNEETEEVDWGKDEKKKDMERKRKSKKK